MRTPHNRYPRFLKNSSDHLHLFTKSLTFPVAAAADPQMNCVRMYFQNPLYPAGENARTRCTS